MTAVTVLFVLLAVALTVPVYAFAVRRLLGLRLSPMRATIGGLVALACASPIITAIGSSIVKHNGSWSFLPAVWFVTLGIAIALLIAMLVLVIFEALVPSGTIPGPLYLIRGLRKRARRVRRYSQIGRILVRRGMLPYLRGTRRSELQTHAGREQLAGSLRLALVHQLVLTFLAATLGIMAVLMLGLHGGPDVTHRVTLYAFIGYCLLVFAGVLALRVLVLVFRPDAA